MRVGGLVQQGHQVASGRSPETPYPGGTIELQKPFFKELGLDLSSFFMGTLNVSIRPYTFSMKRPQYTFRNVKWLPDFHPEDFSFSQCKLLFNEQRYDCWLYYPHPETKTVHFQDPSIVEIIAPHIPGISYGDRVEVVLNPQEIEIVETPVNLS